MALFKTLDEFILTAKVNKSKLTYSIRYASIASDCNGGICKEQTVLNK